MHYLEKLKRSQKLVKWNLIFFDGLNVFDNQAFFWRTDVVLNNSYPKNQLIYNFHIDFFLKKFNYFPLFFSSHITKE